MAEFDVITVTNPTSENLSVTFNGEPYLIQAGEKQYKPKFLAFHMAKVISDKVLQPELEKIKKEGEKNGTPYNPKNAQLMIYDNPTRRKSLYDILESKELVQECIEAFPFKGFIGEMSEYDDYVEKKSSKKSKSLDKEPSEEKKEE